MQMFIFQCMLGSLQTHAACTITDISLSSAAAALHHTLYGDISASGRTASALHCLTECVHTTPGLSHMTWLNSKLLHCQFMTMGRGCHHRLS